MSGRQSGRTTRMCRIAHEMSVRGKTVYILVDSRKDQMQVMSHCNRGDGINVQLLDEKTFDWNIMSFKVDKMPRGIPFENVCVLVDHSVIQRKFPAMIAMYESYAERRGHPRNSIETIERIGKEAVNEMREMSDARTRLHSDYVVQRDELEKLLEPLHKALDHPLNPALTLKN